MLEKMKRKEDERKKMRSYTFLRVTQAQSLVNIESKYPEAHAMRVTKEPSM